MPLPSQMALTGDSRKQPRERAVFHHAAAADALHRLVGVVRRALADPVLADGSAQAHQQVLVAVGPAVHRARDAHGQRERAFALERQVGEHVAHQRLLVEHLAERRADRAVVQSLRHRRALAGRGADHAIEARHRDHLDDRAHAAALLADHPRERAAQLGLARRVRDVAHLALQAQQLQAGSWSPSGRQRGSRKHVRPRGACASTMNASHMGADTKYLWPTSS